MAEVPVLGSSSPDTKRSGNAGFQLWPPPQQQQLIYPSTTSTVLCFGGADGGSAPARGKISCRDCGNQAKKECCHLRCRTCCKSRGFHCPTHVNSTWLPAAKRRERHNHSLLQLGAAGCSQASSSSASEDRGGGALSTTARRAAFPPEVNAEAVFRCVRLGPLAGVDAGEVAYQTAICIGGHVFKGILHDLGPLVVDPAAAASTATDPRSRVPPSASALLTGGSGGRQVMGASAVVLAPYPMPTSFMGGGAHLFPQQPPSSSQ